MSKIINNRECPETDIILIETTRLILRSFTESDFTALSRENKPPSWLRDVTKEPLDIAKPCVTLAAQLKACGTIIGCVFIGRKPELDDEVELGYYIADNYTRSEKIFRRRDDRPRSSVEYTPTSGYYLRTVEGDRPYLVGKCYRTSVYHLRFIRKKVYMGYRQCKTLIRSKSILARPYIVRLITLILLLMPSTKPLLKSEDTALQTASKSMSKPEAKDFKGLISQTE